MSISTAPSPGTAVLPRLGAEGVSLRYRQHTALDTTDLALLAGSVTAIVGPNGSGKTTLLRLIAGIARPSTGLIRLDGVDLTTLPGRERARRIAYVGQAEASDAPFTAREVLGLGRSAHRADWQPTDRSDAEVVESILTLMDLTHLGDRRLGSMSGGERQRVLLARALAQGAETILLDEPTNHLDVHHQQHVLDVLTDLGATVVLVLHDLNLAAAFCDRVVMMGAGRILAEGAPTDVLRPERVEEVYRVRTREVDLGERRHLILGR